MSTSLNSISKSKAQLSRPHPKYVSVPMDPQKTDSILGPMYGKKWVFVQGPGLAESNDLDRMDEEMYERMASLHDLKSRKPPPPPAPIGRSQPNPYPFDKHPAHAARAKWLQDFQDGKVSLAKPANPVYISPRRPGHYFNSKQEPTSLAAHPPESGTLPHQAPYFPANGHQLITPPRSTNPSPCGSNLSPFAQPFFPRPPQY